MSSSIRKPSARHSLSSPLANRNHQANPLDQTAPEARPDILDAVRDQHGTPWIRYGTDERAIWFAVTDLISAPTMVFKNLARAGTIYSARPAQDALKKLVDAHTTYRRALVASHPGWIDDDPIYVFGDGSVIKPEGDGREIIIGFERHSKFEAYGTLKKWQATVKPFIKHQPLPYFAIAFALTGPILHFLSRGQLNPICEIVGKRETGKSTVGVLAASVWAGDPHSQVGGGDTWRMTINAIDEVKLGRRDGLMFADEANLVGVAISKLPDYIQDAIFTLSSDRGKRRMGDPDTAVMANVAVLSTSNIPLRDLVGGHTDKIEALRSRVITITLAPDRPNGIFDTVPKGHPTSGAAAKALQSAANKGWGEPARTFVSELVRRAARDENRLRQLIAKRVDRYLDRLPSSPGSARVKQTLALVAAAASLAQNWGVFPKPWGSPTTMIRAIAQLTHDNQLGVSVSPIERVQAYIRRHQDELVNLLNKKPVSKVEFDKIPGFMKNQYGQTELMIPTAKFRKEFLDHEAFLDILDMGGLIRAENGRQKKRAIKAPRGICPGKRVYCLKIP
ncbi:DUF927 domain-containing protein [Methylobacterium sp. J-030]|uniref:DUF927 domain-containing protein n=1 Tax=Methylobacterium sp. J-030 TaxID=2836627 RepID=UPI001FBB665B|nr:DUF927 domain-containing protein [Methylobacterium sp. J-030]MCJ2071261.1 DUF927 domain-containing protein [Methylobacterium sp. J-030]